MLVTYRIESTSNWLRLINLSAKRAGERSAGNLHAPFDVTGDGTQLTVRLVRHSHRKRGAPDRPNLRVWRHSSTLPDQVQLHQKSGKDDSIFLSQRGSDRLIEPSGLVTPRFFRI